MFGSFFTPKMKNVHSIHQGFYYDFCDSLCKYGGDARRLGQSHRPIPSYLETTHATPMIQPLESQSRLLP